MEREREDGELLGKVLRSRGTCQFCLAIIVKVVAIQMEV